MMKKKIKAFDIVLVLIFIVFSLIMIIPVYKVLVDSFDLKTAYGMKLFPEQFGFAGYKSIFTNPTMFRPFLISCYTTFVGTLIGLLISVLGAYALIQWKMPGRALLANVLLFTMIFHGGMIPTYLVMKSFHLTNNLWGVILLKAIHRVFRNNGLRCLNLDFRQLCRLLIQSLCAGGNAGRDKACDKFAFFIDDIKGVCCAVINDNSRAAVNLICRHKVNDTVRADGFRIIPFNHNPRFHPNADNHRFDIEIFANPLRERIHNIGDNRGNDNRLDLPCIYPCRIKETMNKNAGFICCAIAAGCHSPTLYQFFFFI